MTTAHNAFSKPIAQLLAEVTIGDSSLSIVGDASTVIRGISYDSRRVQPGDLFVALRGGYFDGHEFLDEARERGAAAFLVERRTAVDVPQIVAADSRAALARVADSFFDHPSDALGVIGVTGTDGKTTTSHIIEAILRVAGFTTGMIGTISVRVGDTTVDLDTRQTTPESVDVQRHLHEMRSSAVDWAIVEATSHGLDLHRLDEVRFVIGAVTNITHEHLEHHKTIAAYRRAKAILFERVAAAKGAAVVNLDDAGAREMLRYAGAARRLTYSLTDANADLWASDIRLDVNGSRFTLHVGARSLACTLPLLGAFNVENAMCAAGVGLAVGIDLEAIQSAMATAPMAPGRMARIDRGQPFAVIVDYAHTPESLTKVLRLLQSLNHGKGRIIAVSGSAGERDVLKRPLQGAASATYAELSVFTSEDPRFEDPDKIIAEIAEGAASVGGVPGSSYHCITDRREAIRFAFEAACPGDTVLLAGKGHERSIIWGLEKRPWDEEKIAREVLGEMGFSGS